MESETVWRDAIQAISEHRYRPDQEVERAVEYVADEVSSLISAGWYSTRHAGYTRQELEDWLLDGDLDETDTPDLLATEYLDMLADAYDTDDTHAVLADTYDAHDVVAMLEEEKYDYWTHVADATEL